MAITITRIDEENLKAEFAAKGFKDLKSYVEHIVKNRNVSDDLVQKAAELETLKNHVITVQTLSNQVAYLLDRAVKAGLNRSDLNKQLLNIK